MASSRTKRRRKHRGTQAGTVSRPARSSSGSGAKAAGGKKPATKAEAREQTRQRREDRLNRAPTWRGALNRAAISAAIFGVLVVVLFHRPVSIAIVLAAVMLLLYIPLGYYTDRLIYTRRQRRRPAPGGGEGGSARAAERPRGRR